MKARQSYLGSIGFGVGLCLALAMPARADVEVGYLVDATAFKAAISGTSLTFTLYTDAACTNVAATNALNVENTTVIEQLKRLTPKGATKAPKTARLTATLTGVTPPATAFLKVTGTGITAVGGDCQIQLSSGAPTGIAGDGFVKAWARVNSDGTIASCYNCNPAGSVHTLSSGSYIVDFSPLTGNIAGRPRTATLDTLGGGSLTGEISVADSVGLPSGVFVRTLDSSGINVDQSFSLVLY